MTDETVIAKAKELSKANEATNQPQPQAQHARQPQQPQQPPHQSHQPQQAAPAYPVQTHQIPPYGYNQPTPTYPHGHYGHQPSSVPYQAPNIYPHQYVQAQAAPYYTTHWTPAAPGPYNHTLMTSPAQGQQVAAKPQTPNSSATKRASKISIKFPNGKEVAWEELAATTNTTTTTTATTTTVPATTAATTTTTPTTTQTTTQTATPKTETKITSSKQASTVASSTPPTATTTTTTTSATTPTKLSSTTSNNNNKNNNSNNISNANETNSSPSVSNIFLQKVSEEGSTDSAATPVLATPTKTPTPTKTRSNAKENEVVVVKQTKDIVENENKIVDSTSNVDNDKKIATTGAINDISEDNDKKGETETKKDVSEKEETKQDGEAKKGEEGVSGEPQLKYESWQYNPYANRNGRKVYSKEFLLDVCEKVMKLDIFPSSDIGAQMGHYPHDITEQRDLFAPAFTSQHHPSSRQNDSARRPNHHNYLGRSSAGQEKRKIIAPSSSLTQEVELKTVSNPWRPAKQVKEDTPQDVVEVEDLKKKFRSILNKLTPNNFDNLSSQVTTLPIDTETKLGELIDIIFAKALSEPGYSVLYGQMCSHLKKISAGTADFGTTLLKRCQNQFQSDIYASLNLDERNKKIDDEKDPDVKKQLQDELYEDMYNCRMRGLGLIKFIGELYKIQMLNDKIMFECIARLLSDTSDESLECLCDLLVTIGEKLDKSSKNAAAHKAEEKKQQKAPKLNAYQGGNKSAAAVVASGPAQHVIEPEPLATLNPVFEKLHAYRKNKELPISLRIRYKLLDVCELREKESWQSKKTKDGNPKKIEEIREAHKEKLESERRQNAMGPRRSQEGRRGLGHSSGSSNQISSLANESSGRGGSNMHSSSSSHSIRDYSTGDNMKANHNDEQGRAEHQRNLQKVLSLSQKKPQSKEEKLVPRFFKTGAAFEGSSLRPTTTIGTKVVPQAPTTTTTNTATKK